MRTTASAGSLRLATRRWVLVASALLAAVALVLLAAARLMGAPTSVIQQLAILLLLSGAVSLLAGEVLLRAVASRLPSLRFRIIIASGIGLVVAIANVLATSWLMFLSEHDLGLLLLLLAFAGVVSLAFAIVTAGSLAREIEQVSIAADRLASGDRSSRVLPRGTDEVARLGRAFDRLADQLEAAFQLERQLEQGRRDLVAAVSHDLRTPLATTRAMVESITDGVVTEEGDVKRYLSLILMDVQHLSGLIDDLFELSQIESGGLRLQPLPIVARDLMAETVAAYEARALALGVTLSAGRESGVIRLRADPARAAQVLRNLLDNALRITPAGGHIAVQVEVADGAARFTVRDSGPGVPEAGRERVFEQFYRGEPSRSRSGEPDRRGSGAGLGLAIAQGLVRAMGGTIWVDDAPGGAAFHFTLPLQVSADLPQNESLGLRS